MPLDNEIYFCIKYYLYIIYLLYGWGKLVSSIQVQQGAKITPVPFEAGETLLSALRRAGYSIPAACGGKGRCGKCRVKVNGVPRLACKTRAQDGDWIDLPETMRGVILTDTLTLPKAQAGRSGLGAAVDLGTTTVALRLFDRADGKLLAQAQDWNAQAPYGADVISRIQHTMEASDGLGELSRCIRAQTETLLGQTLSAAGRKLDEVKELVIAGNTVMQHIFDGREVASIARAPFQPETLFEDGAGEPLSGIPVQFAPCVAGYVGGDITAGLLADGLFVQPELRLFLDIGTNGEMALGNESGALCCAVASGPAFEGAGISCGMPGITGAVSHVSYDRGFLCDIVGGDITAGLLADGLFVQPELRLFLDIGTNGEMALGNESGALCCAVASGPAFEGAGISCGMPGITGAVSHVSYDRGFLCDIVGGGEAKGICGSGLVDLVAVLLERGVIDESGRLLPPQDAPEDMRRYLTEDGQGNGVFHLTKAVSLTARDVRNLQLAKAAVAGGIRVLLEQRGVTADDIASVELAGGFGNYLSPENVVRIGMLPRACLSKIRPLGNASLAGASMLALDGENWRKLAEIPEKCRYLELSGRDDFSRAFTDSLTF